MHDGYIVLVAFRGLLRWGPLSHHTVATADHRLTADLSRLLAGVRARKTDYAPLRTRRQRGHCCGVRGAYSSATRSWSGSGCGGRAQPDAAKPVGGSVPLPAAGAHSRFELKPSTVGLVTAEISEALRRQHSGPIPKPKISALIKKNGTSEGSFLFKSGQNRTVGGQR
jgi:hypothetical protein